MTTLSTPVNFSPRGSRDGLSPIRAGVFETVSTAVAAVCDLLDAGFSKEQITVICSDKKLESPFREFEHQKLSGVHTEKAIVLGGIAGVILGAALALTGLMAMGRLDLFLTVVVVAGVGGMTGTFVGAMLTRGTEKELADFYDQSVIHGKILVSAEARGPSSEVQLDRASRILAQAGAVPIALPESE